MVLNSNNFDDLPEKEQVHRLRNLADAALEKFGFNQYQLTFLQHLVNTTFRQRREALLQGYREIYELPDEHLSLIPTFMAMRASSLRQWDRVGTLLHTSYADL